MKKSSKISCLSLLSLLNFALLTSCETTSSSSEPSSSSITISSPSSSSSSEETQARKYIEIDRLPKTTYDLYDILSLDNLDVSFITEKDGEQTIEHDFDYSLIWDKDKTEVQASVRLNEVGTFKINVVAAGYESASFEITVNKISHFNQSLMLTSTPLKSVYKVGETLDPSGLNIMLHTSYRSSTGQTLQKSETVTSYQLKYNGTDASNYVFLETGRFQINIVCQGYEEELTTYFTVYVNNEKISDPQKYDDPSSVLETDASSISIHITNPNKTSNEDPHGITDKGYYTPKEVNVAHTAYDFGKINSLNWKYAPSSPIEEDQTSQETPILVVPVVVPGFEEQATSKALDVIETCFFGNSNTLPFESLRSYYYKSSHGKLNITGSITDFYYASAYSSFYHSITDISSSNLSDLAEEVVAWTKETYSNNLTKFDSDKDGLIDAVWMVWIGDISASDGYSSYWPLTNTTQADANISENLANPVCNNFGWAGENLFETFSEENSPYDAHFLIHETGHILGLNDYYSYNNSGSLTSGYSPLGGIDMMDNNVKDHNPYSKILLGWETPYIVYGNDVTITIPSSLMENACIVIPYDNKEYESENGKIQFNPYDEYLILDLYTNKGLNEMSYDGYGNKEDFDLKSTGGRLYHVDARLAYQRTGSTYVLFTNPDDAFNEEYEKKVLNVISNSEGGSRSEHNYGLPAMYDAYDEIRWISQDNVLVDYQNKPGENSLFTQGDSFSVQSYARQFNNGGFNSNNLCSYSFTITELKLA